MFDFPMTLNVAYSSGAISGFTLERNGFSFGVPFKNLTRAQKKRLRRLDGKTVGYTGSSTMEFDKEGKAFDFRPSSFGIHYKKHQYWFCSYEKNLDVHTNSHQAFLQQAHNFLYAVYP